MSLFNLLSLVIIWRVHLHCVLSRQISELPLASMLFVQVCVCLGSLAKLSGVQNQASPHFVLAQVSFLFRIPAHFTFTW